MTMKRCSKCGTVKAIVLFAKNKRRPDGHHAHCSECSRLAVRKAHAAL